MIIRTLLVVLLFLSIRLFQVLIQELALIVDIEFVTSLTTLLEAFADKTATVSVCVVLYEESL